MKDKLSAIIVDDELHGRENLKKIIETYCREINILGVANSAVTAKELVIELNPDIVFLDISMPILDGFDFLDEFEERNFSVVFVTAHEEYGVKAVKAGAADYILKPVNIKELKQTIKKLLSNHIPSSNGRTVEETNKLIVPSSHGFNVFEFDDIMRIEADGCYTKIVRKNGKTTTVSRTLKEFEDTLPQERFIRIHKSHLINMNYIKEYSSYGGNYITMNDGSKIEISRRRTPDFIQKIKAIHNTV
jgi:two-component system LytT family response regulator